MERVLELSATIQSAAAAGGTKGQVWHVWDNTQRGVATEVNQRGSDQTHHSRPTPQKATALVEALRDYVLP